MSEIKLTPLQECIAECGVNAPLYTVPSDKHPKPMVVEMLGPIPFTVSDQAIWQNIADLDTDSQEYVLATGWGGSLSWLPDITPVMPKPGERWLTRGGLIVDVVTTPDGRICALYDTDDVVGHYEIYQWGRHPDRRYDNRDLILPYIQPHD